MYAQKKLTGTAIAAAAAGLFLAGTTFTGVASAETEEANVHCYGVNSCKGSGACKTAENACAGKNSCKGKGWVEMTKAECDEKGGEAK
ncbi:MAG: hypothetical protein LJE70_06745 [Chromatiaceae bacterium]|jgi:hypothetical protein|nr:hypothetical protein [Chromatiaceae bacterium]